MADAQPGGDVTEKRIHYGATFAVLSIAALAFSLLQSMIIPALPELEHSLHTSATGATWLLTAYLLSAAIATPILGRVGDMVGKEKMLVVVLVALSLGTLLSALSTTLPVMLLGRAVQGTGGAVFPLAFGIIRDEFPRAKVSTGIGIMSAILGIGVGGGIVLAGPIIEHLSYHWLFWIPLGMTLLATAATFVFVPESPVRAPGRINWRGAGCMSAWLVTGLLAVSEGPVWGWMNATVLALFGTTVLFILLWVWSEVASDSPVVDMTMMRIPAVWSTNLAALLFGFGMFVFFITVPQFVQTSAHEGYGFSASVTQSGLFLLPFALAMLLVAPLTGRLAIAFGSKPLLIAGSVFSATSYGFLTVADSQPWNVYVAAGLLGVGIALGYASMANLIIEAVPANQTGVATGMNTNIRNIGAALGSAVATSIIVSGLHPGGLPEKHGYTVAFAVSGVSLVIAAVAALTIPNRRHSPVVASLAHPGLTGEAEVFVGAAAYGSDESP